MRLGYQMELKTTTDNFGKTLEKYLVSVERRHREPRMLETTICNVLVR